MMGYGAGAWFGLGGWLMVIGGVVLVIGLVLLIAWAVGRAGDHRGAAGSRDRAVDDAVEVLRLRFARGEMTAEEYMAARQTLEGGR